MKKGYFALLAAAFLGLSVGVNAGEAAEVKALKVDVPFESSVLVEGLDMPWDLHWGPDGMLWVTERMGKRVTRVDPKTGQRKVAVTIEDAHAAGGHQGILGMAFGPDFSKNLRDGHVYVVYTYTTDKGQVDAERKRIVRFEYDQDSQTLVSPVTIIEGIPAGDDHNGGRLVFGPDRKMYLSLGELGHNQLQNFRKLVEAQRLPTSAEVATSDWSAYLGKVLRINADGSIPEDNPVLNGVRSHVFSYGHRNPQGLTFAGEYLYSSEHGPSTDDEVNLIVSGGNYGWPHVAGFIDDQAYVYANWSKSTDPDVKYSTEIPASVPVQKESQWKVPDNFHGPMRSFYTVPEGYKFEDSRYKMGYMGWATVAPSSVVYYPKDGAIVEWRNSLLMTTLKAGALLVLPLTSDMSHLQGREMMYFHTPNRYRSVCFDKATSTVYVITDSSGNFLDSAWNESTTVQNPGAILMFKYAPGKK